MSLYNQYHLLNSLDKLVIFLKVLRQKTLQKSLNKILFNQIVAKNQLNVISFQNYKRIFFQVYKFKINSTSKICFNNVSSSSFKTKPCNIHILIKTIHMDRPMWPVTMKTHWLL